MAEEKEKTALCSSVGADERQSIQICSNLNITEPGQEIKGELSEAGTSEDLFRQMRRVSDPSYLRTVTMADLYDTVFESEPPLIDGLLYRGTYLFVGSPKVGKSFMMAQIAYHVSTGLPLWGYTVRRARVLYFALEDGYSRLQRRLYKMFGTEGTGNLHFATECKTVADGLDEQIRGFMREHPDTGLIIIDTLKRVREAGGADYSYTEDYDIVAKLKSLADRFNVTMLIVHHTRKQKADDIFDMISGTNGLLGAADGAFFLSKEKRTSNNAVLDITGRDQQDQRIHLVRDPHRLVWDFEEAETELWVEPPDPVLERVSEMLFSAGNQWEGTPTELCERLCTDIKPNALTLRLNINAGRLMKDYGIRYTSRRSHDGRKVSLWRDAALTA